MTMNTLLERLETVNVEINKTARNSGLNQIDFFKANEQKPISEDLQKVYKMQNRMIPLLERKLDEVGNKLTGLEVAAVTQALVELGKILEGRE